MHADARLTGARPLPSGVRPALPAADTWARDFKVRAYADFMRLVVAGNGDDSTAWQLVALSAARALKLVKWAATADEAIAALSRHYGVDAFPGARGTDAPLVAIRLEDVVRELELEPYR